MHTNSPPQPPQSKNIQTASQFIIQKTHISSQYSNQAVSTRYADRGTATCITVGLNVHVHVHEHVTLIGSHGCLVFHTCLSTHNKSNKTIISPPARTTHVYHELTLLSPPTRTHTQTIKTKRCDPINISTL